MQTVLVVEDDDDLRDIICRVLTDEGFATRAASNGLDALLILQGDPLPDLILLDLMMPVMNGWVFRTQQEADPRLAEVPVVVMTAAARLDDAAIAGAALIRKPLRHRDLLAVVRAHLNPDETDEPAARSDGTVMHPLDVGDSPPSGV